MNPRDRRLVTWLVVLSDRLPGFIDQVLYAEVSQQEWNEFADMLAGTGKLCRERGITTLDIGDSGGR